MQISRLKWRHNSRRVEFQKVVTATIVKFIVNAVSSCEFRARNWRNFGYMRAEINNFDNNPLSCRCISLWIWRADVNESAREISLATHLTQQFVNVITSDNLDRGAFNGRRSTAGVLQEILKRKYESAVIFSVYMSAVCADHRARIDVAGEAHLRNCTMNRDKNAGATETGNAKNVLCSTLLFSEPSPRGASWTF